jgi:hypothetical protein
LISLFFDTRDNSCFVLEHIVLSAQIALFVIVSIEGTIITVFNVAFVIFFADSILKKDVFFAHHTFVHISCGDLNTVFDSNFGTVSVCVHVISVITKLTRSVVSIFQTIIKFFGDGLTDSICIYERIKANNTFISVASCTSLIGSWTVQYEAG